MLLREHGAYISLNRASHTYMQPTSSTKRELVRGSMPSGVVLLFGMIMGASQLFPRNRVLLSCLQPHQRQSCPSLSLDMQKPSLTSLAVLYEHIAFLLA